MSAQLRIEQLKSEIVSFAKAGQRAADARDLETCILCTNEIQDRLRKLMLLDVQVAPGGMNIDDLRKEGQKLLDKWDNPTRH